MGRKLRHVLIFLLIILKEPNMPEATCNPSVPVLIGSVCGPVVGIVLIGAILTIWYKMKTRDPHFDPNVVTGRHANKAVSMTTTGPDQHYEDIDSQQDQTGHGQSQTITRAHSSTKTTAAVVASGSAPRYEDMNQHNLAAQGQTKASTESNIKTPSVATFSHDNRYENMKQHNQTGQGKSHVIAASNTNPTADVLVSGHGPNASYSKLNSHFKVEDQYQGLIKSTTTAMTRGAKSPPKDPASTEIASGHDQTEQGQSQTITEGQGQSQARPEASGMINPMCDALLAALQPNPMYVGVKTLSKDPASTDIASGHDQTGQGQSQIITEPNVNTTALATCGQCEAGQGKFQARPEDLDMINPMCDALLAALQANPMYVGVKTLSKDPASTEKASGHDQIGQGQSQSKTIATPTVVTSGNGQSDQGQSLDIRNLLRDALFSLLQSNPMYVDVKTLPKDPASADLASGHDQTGQDQSQALTQSFNIGNLPRDALLAALLPNRMYESAKTPPKDPTSTEITSGHDQTGQGQSQAIAELNTIETPIVMASGHDQTGQGQYQPLIKSNTNTTGAAMANDY
ncbi:Bax inhibitor 1 [Branchiostoma belcheri]|nr:Bax inhibitor 1 [Branchiostoma belcheri]